MAKDDNMTERKEAAVDPLWRQAALREWHRNPAVFPRSFEEHLQAGDLDRWLAAQASA